MKLESVRKCLRPRHFFLYHLDTALARDREIPICVLRQCPDRPQTFPRQSQDGSQTAPRQFPESDGEVTGKCPEPAEFEISEFESEFEKRITAPPDVIFFTIFQNFSEQQNRRKKVSTLV
jgi:hypothetical protein